ncbi:XRE family transcriptional regulator [Phenylobacterium sp.]|uniref:XRE family transcriptional regulator n=1 Tax=Phenylobacterium sp. TaxID=1871053 RepID=UPI0035ADE938
MARPDALPLSLPPRGLSREVAAQYIGVSVGKFDEMVGDGRMPQPKRIDARKLWDRDALDRAFWALPEDGEGVGGEANPWDNAA